MRTPDLRYLLLLGIKPFSNSLPILTANQWPSLPSYSVSTTRKTSPLVKARLCGVSFSHSKWLLIKNESPLPQASMSLYTERQKHCHMLTLRSSRSFLEELSASPLSDYPLYLVFIYQVQCMYRSHGSNRKKGQKTELVSFVYQLDWATGFLGIWPNLILGV